MSVLDSQSHLLHGMLHANGFGHLMRINGLEGGSSSLTGQPATQHVSGRVCISISICLCRVWADVQFCLRAGKQIMSIWDKLCTVLRARHVSVEDVSNKVWRCCLSFEIVCKLCPTHSLQTAAAFLIEQLPLMIEQVGMELRVLHAAAFRNTWYGQWGYGFGRGGFAISRSAWRKSADSVSKALLDDILADFNGTDAQLTEVIERYKVTH